MNQKYKKSTTGEIIKQSRQSLNLTQQELGDKLNPPVSQSLIGRWEKQADKYFDKCSIDTSYLYQLSNILKVNLFEYYLGFDIIGYIINNSSMCAQFREFVIEDEINDELHRVMKDKLVAIYNDDFLIIKRKKLDEPTIDAILGKIIRFEMGEGYKSKA